MGAGALAAWAGGPPGGGRAPPPCRRPPPHGPYDVMALLDATAPSRHAAGGCSPTRATRTGHGPSGWTRRLSGPDDTWELDFRCYAVRRPVAASRLVDTGIGPAGSPASGWAPVPGHLPSVLRLAGMSGTTSITVVLTHLHEDHFGWTVDPAGPRCSRRPPCGASVRRSRALDADDSAPSYVVEPLRRAGLLHQIDGRVTRAGPPGRCVTDPPYRHTRPHPGPPVRARRRAAGTAS
ncbi:hypothetical protein GCM10023238_35000 [Streptomyces heliomycini]